MQSQEIFQTKTQGNFQFFILNRARRFIQVVFVNRGKEDSRKATRDAIDAYTTRVKVRFTVALLMLTLIPNCLSK